MLRLRMSAPVSVSRLSTGLTAFFPLVATGRCMSNGWIGQLVAHLVWRIAVTGSLTDLSEAV